MPENILVGAGGVACDIGELGITLGKFCPKFFAPIFLAVGRIKLYFDVEEVMLEHPDSPATVTETAISFNNDLCINMLLIL